MKNRIINITADGSWQTVSENFPQDTRHLLIRARTSAALTYKFEGQDAYMTVAAGTSEVLSGRFAPGDIQVMAANGVVIELQCSTVEYGGFS